MIKPFVSIETAKSNSHLIFIEVLMRLKAYCKEHNLNSFYDITEKYLKTTPIIWKKIGFINAGKTIKYHKHYGVNYKIEMNINYLYSKDAKDFIKLTLIHELTHIIADCYDGSFGHNKTFKMFDKLFGGKGTRCAEYSEPINAPKRKRIEFTCPYCGNTFKLTPYMIQKCKTGKYSCIKCHTNMVEVLKQCNI